MRFAARAWLAMTVLGFLVANAPCPARADSDLPACPGQAFPIAHVPGGSSPYIQLTAGGVTGAFLLDYGATSSTLSSNAFPASGGSPRRLPFNLPGFASGLFAMTTYGFDEQPPGGIIGVVGTDFLSLLNVRFAGDLAYISPTPCPPEALRAAGFVPISQEGFFSSRPAPDGRFANAPIVRLRLGGIPTWAQFDTGYDGLADRPSIDINQAYYDQLVASGFRLQALPDTRITTCVGAETRHVFLASGSSLAIEDDTGARLREIAEFRLLLKPSGACGGIAGLDIPAAQLDASFLRLLGEVVFDPFSKAVWIKTKPMLR